MNSNSTDRYDDAHCWGLFVSCDKRLFSAHDDKGAPFVNWYHGVVDELLNEKGRRVSIKWDEDCLGTKDACITKHHLGITKWNPEICTDGAWRHYITE